MRVFASGNEACDWNAFQVLCAFCDFWRGVPFMSMIVTLNLAPSAVFVRNRNTCSTGAGLPACSMR